MQKENKDNKSEGRVYCSNCKARWLPNVSTTTDSNRANPGKSYETDRHFYLLDPSGVFKIPPPHRVPQRCAQKSAAYFEQRSYPTSSLKGDAKLNITKCRQPTNFQNNFISAHDKHQISGRKMYPEENPASSKVVPNISVSSKNRGRQGPHPDHTDLAESHISSKSHSNQMGPNKMDKPFRVRASSLSSSVYFGSSGLQSFKEKKNEPQIFKPDSLYSKMPDGEQRGLYGSFFLSEKKLQPDRQHYGVQTNTGHERHKENEGMEISKHNFPKQRYNGDLKNVKSDLIATSKSRKPLPSSDSLRSKSHAKSIAKQPKKTEQNRSRSYQHNLPKQSYGTEDEGRGSNEVRQSIDTVTSILSDILDVFLDSTDKNEERSGDSHISSINSVQGYSNLRNSIIFTKAQFDEIRTIRPNKQFRASNPAAAFRFAASSAVLQEDNSAFTMTGYSEDSNKYLPKKSGASNGSTFYKYTNKTNMSVSTSSTPTSSVKSDLSGIRLSTDRKSSKTDDPDVIVLVSYSMSDTDQTRETNFHKPSRIFNSTLSFNSQYQTDDMQPTISGESKPLRDIQGLSQSNHRKEGAATDLGGMWYSDDKTKQKLSSHSIANSYEKAETQSELSLSESDGDYFDDENLNVLIKTHYDQSHEEPHSSNAADRISRPSSLQKIEEEPSVSLKYSDDSFSSYINDEYNVQNNDRQRNKRSLNDSAVTVEVEQQYQDTNEDFKEEPHEDDNDQNLTRSKKSNISVDPYTDVSPQIRRQESLSKSNAGTPGSSISPFQIALKAPLSYEPSPLSSSTSESSSPKISPKSEAKPQNQGHESHSENESSSTSNDILHQPESAQSTPRNEGDDQKANNAITEVKKSELLVPSNITSDLKIKTEDDRTESDSATEIMSSKVTPKQFQINNLDTDPGFEPDEPKYFNETIKRDMLIRPRLDSTITTNSGEGHVDQSLTDLIYADMSRYGQVNSKETEHRFHASDSASSSSRSDHSAEMQHFEEVQTIPKQESQLSFRSKLRNVPSGSTASEDSTDQKSEQSVRDTVHFALETNQRSYSDSRHSDSICLSKDEFDHLRSSTFHKPFRAPGLKPIIRPSSDSQRPSKDDERRTSENSQVSIKKKLPETELHSLKQHIQKTPEKGTELPSHEESFARNKKNSPASPTSTKRIKKTVGIDIPRQAEPSPEPKNSFEIWKMSNPPSTIEDKYTPIAEKKTKGSRLKAIRNVDWMGMPRTPDTQTRRSFPGY